MRSRARFVLRGARGTARRGAGVGAGRGTSRGRAVARSRNRRGPVGRLLTQRALDEGHAVTAATRHPDAFPVQARERLVVLEGDVCRLADVARAVAGQDVVLTMVGVPYTFKPVTVYSVGITSILAAMQEAGLRRVIAVTSGGTNPKLPPGPQDRVGDPRRRVDRRRHRRTWCRSRRPSRGRSTRASRSSPRSAERSARDSNVACETGL
ncbi:MAG: NAD(P)H-binding protein [Myxococcales bacterium]|nr:NAD(P)H-binding protein [Myxococcales bacterium]